MPSVWWRLFALFVRNLTNIRQSEVRLRNQALTGGATARSGPTPHVMKRIGSPSSTLAERFCAKSPPEFGIASR
jgi:hypothetical protein